MLLKIMNLLIFSIMVIMNYLANAIPINNRTTGELSDQYPNLFVPAGITFSIWGVIYFLLFLFVLLQFRETNRQIVTAIGWAFVISSLLNAAWIISWHYQQLPVSMLIMTGILASLIYINYQLINGAPLIFKATFGIYLGWICIATIANATTLLVHYNWGGIGISPQTWAIIMIAAGAAISIAAMIRLENPYLALAVIWAFVGIILKRTNDYPAIAITAAMGIIIIFLVMVIRQRYIH